MTAGWIEELVLVSESPADSAAFLERCLPTLIAGATTEEFASVRYVASSDVEHGAPSAGDRFWKFSVFADDIVALRAEIQQAGLAVSDPVQFGQIGFLCHFVEPGGIEVELLQRTFAGTAREGSPRAPGLGLITLRTDDRVRSSSFYEDELDMTALAEMAVDAGRPDPFDLLFFAPTPDRPPHADLSHVENREWLYQRPFTIVELQHHRTPRQQSPTPPAAGLAEIGIRRLPSELVSPDGHRFATRA